MSRKEHWEKVYSTKQINEVSWFQQTPGESLRFFQQLDIPKTASVIDIGGGDSLLVDHLLELGYSDVTVLDISEKAINRAKVRLGNRSQSVNWIVSDVLELNNDKQFDCWHDRAAFHFLTTAEQIEKYLSVSQKQIRAGGKMIIGTFSTEGPEKCSGLPVKQYDEKTLSKTLKKWFEKIKCITTDHITPFKTIQNFLFCSFKKISI